MESIGCSVSWQMTRTAVCQRETRSVTRIHASDLCLQRIYFGWFRSCWISATSVLRPTDYHITNARDPLWHEVRWIVLIFHDSKYHLTSRTHDRFDRETRLSFCIRLSYYAVYILHLHKYYDVYRIWSKLRAQKLQRIGNLFNENRTRGSLGTIHDS